MKAEARYWAKRLARGGMALASCLSGSLAARALLARGPRVRVLTYHRFACDRPRDPFCLRPETFEAQMRVLAQQRRAVSLDRVRRFVAGEEDLPDGSCLVTIDDGLTSTFTEALPVLRRWGIPAAAFVSAGLLESRLRYPEPHMSFAELRELASSGLVSVGSHGYSHRSLGLMRPDEARDEVRRSRERLEDRLGIAVTSFAYPFGTRGDFTPATDGALRDAGYTIAFHSMHGVVRVGDDPISLPRVKVESGEGLWMFELAIRGAMDGWRAVDHTLYWMQRDRFEQAVDEVSVNDGEEVGSRLAA